MSVKRNFIASFVANLCTAVVSVLLVPLYIDFIGIEAYGLVGIFGMLQAMTSLLDFGFTVTMNRELARYAAQPEAADEMRDFVRTLELIYWGIAIVIGIIFCVFIPTFGVGWIKTVSLPQNTIRASLILIGLIVASQWPFSFYAGGLIGLQKQGQLAIANVLLAIFRGVGAILVLKFIEPTVEIFFVWQLSVSSISTVLVVILLWRNLPSSSTHPRFEVSQIKRVWRFSVGVSAVSILALILSQMDKVILSRILTLDVFGYYVLAGAVCTNLYMLVNPIYNAVFPRLIQLVENGDQAALGRFYHQSSEMLAAILVPAVVILALFSEDIIFAWTGNRSTAVHTGPILTLMSIGTGMHGLAHVPWGLQLSYGWTRLGFGLNLAGVIIFVPLVVVMASTYGAIGGAAAWGMVNTSYLLVSQVLMHRRLLKGEMWQWFSVDVGRPVIASLLVAGAGKMLIQSTPYRFLLLIELMIVSGSTLISSLLIAPGNRVWLKTRLTIIKRN